MMPNDKLCCLASLTSLTRLTFADIDWASDLLTRAFISLPPVNAFFEDIEESKATKKVSHFMRYNIRYALNYGNGEGFTNARREGVALWLPPGASYVGLLGLLRAGMMLAPVNFGPTATLRLIRFAHQIDQIHRLAAPMPHQYLFIAGVEPSRRGLGINSSLLMPKLAQFDKKKIATYLETQNYANVELYTKLGFQLVNHQKLRGFDNLENWAMLRQAHPPQSIDSS